MTFLKLESSQELVAMETADLTENKSQNANNYYTESESYNQILLFQFYNSLLLLS